MNIRQTLLVVAISAIVCVPALAETGGEIAKRNNCLLCHAADKKLVGPGFKSIAEKYRGKAAAVVELRATVRGGGKGVWGPVVMPANPRLNDEELVTVVAWILAQ